jgi:hypothetical protein
LQKASWNRRGFDWPTSTKTAISRAQLASSLDPNPEWASSMVVMGSPSFRWALLMWCIQIQATLVWWRMGWSLFLKNTLTSPWSLRSPPK